MKKLLPAVLLASVAASSAVAAPAFVNGLAIPGNTLDATGVNGANQGRAGFFSDIYYDPNRKEWWGLSDRGPGGGSIDYETRAQRFTVDVNQMTGAVSNFQIAQTVKFTDAAGNAFNGRSPNPGNVLGRALDPEGFVVNPRTGNFLVSDEYGPSLYEFNRSGQLLRSFTTPANLIPRNGSTGAENYASDTGNTAGKRSNRGFEGLAISPDGKFAFAMLQSPMLDEGGGVDGRYARIVKFDTSSGEAVAQYAYQMDRSGQGQGISSLVALNDHEFLVLERNNRGVGVGATLATADKNVYRIDTSNATDVSGKTLPVSGTSLAAGVVAVSKSSNLIDLDAHTLAALGNKSPEKWEGLAIGPSLDNGGYLILAGTDNDYSVTQNASGRQFDVYFRMDAGDPYAASIQCPIDTTTDCFFTSNNPAAPVLTTDYTLLPGVLHAYAASAQDLAGYLRPVPEPSSMLLLGLSLAVMGVQRARLRATGQAAAS